LGMGLPQLEDALTSPRSALRFLPACHLCASPGWLR
jgi:hypothetical protein